LRIQCYYTFVLVNCLCQVIRGITCASHECIVNIYIYYTAHLNKMLHYLTCVHKYKNYTPWLYILGEIGRWSLGSTLLHALVVNRGYTCMLLNYWYTTRERLLKQMCSNSMHTWLENNFNAIRDGWFVWLVT